MSNEFREIYLSEENEEAYAKLQGPNVKEFLKKKTVIIGREPGESTEDIQTIVFRESQKVSRHHLKIFWDQISQEWKVQSLSKNKIYINKKLIKKGDQPIPLPDCAAIKFDKYYFYFFPAI